MKYEFIKSKDLLIVKIKIPEQHTVSDERIVVEQGDVEKLISENFNCPKGYAVGKCLDHMKRLDSYNEKCEGSWTFELKKLTKSKTKKPNKSKAS